MHAMKRFVSVLMLFLMISTVSAETDNLVWSVQIQGRPVYFAFSNDSAVIGSFIYNGSWTSWVYTIKNGTILWSNEYEGRRIAGITVSDGLIYIALPNSIEFFDLSGNLIGNFTSKSKILGLQNATKGVVVRTSMGFYVLNGNKLIEKA
ncbi:hypothetical protein [Thermococcus sp.]